MYGLFWLNAVFTLLFPDERESLAGNDAPFFCNIFYGVIACNPVHVLNLYPVCRRRLTRRKSAPDPAQSLKIAARFHLQESS
jgi:hypothetical protein